MMFGGFVGRGGRPRLADVSAAALILAHFLDTRFVLAALAGGQRLLAPIMRLTILPLCGSHVQLYSGFADE